MRLLPILWAEPPTNEDWERLSAARTAIGYTDLIKPAQALQGSPGPVLAVGAYPTWLTPFAYVEDTSDPEALKNALDACLNPNWGAEQVATLLSSWMGAEVKYVGEEEYDGGVQFT